MPKLGIALLQLLPGRNADEALSIGRTALQEAAARGADIALFPEMWSCGYRIPADPAELADLALPRDGEWVSAFGHLAKEFSLAVGVGYLEAFSPAPRNSFALFDRQGREVLHYAKVHTCDFGDEARLTPGEELPVADLETAAGCVKVGSMICYDREFPETARILMLRGTELILVPNACPMEINRLAQLRARTFENMLAIATANYPAGQPDCNGHSSLFDGVAYLPELSGSRDTCLLEAGETPGIYMAELDLGLLRAYRAEEVHGNAYRRPELYAELLSDRIDPPFIRVDRRHRQ